MTTEFARESHASIRTNRRVSLGLLYISLSLPIAIIAMWVALHGEPAYRYVLRFSSELKWPRGGWAFIVMCRIAAWLLLPLALVQFFLLVTTAVRLFNRNARRRSA